MKNGTANIKGKLKENLINNKELAELSKILGTININVPIEEKISDLHIKDWNYEEILNIFKELNFNRFIERFNLLDFQDKKENEKLFNIVEKDIIDILKIVEKQKKFIYYLNKTVNKYSENIIKKNINSISIFNIEEDEIYYIKIENLEDFLVKFKEIFESDIIEKYGINLSEDYVFLREHGVILNNMVFDAELAGYILNSTNKSTLKSLALEYLNIDIDEYINNNELESEEKMEQINLFDNIEGNNEDSNEYKIENAIFVYCIGKLKDILFDKLKEINSFDLYKNIEMPLIQVLSEMQFSGMYIEKQDLIEIGNKLKESLQELTDEIHKLAGEEFNINSPQQLGKILFEKLKLPVIKKTKTGYSTDVDILEKLVNEHSIIEKILEYRSLMKLNSTYAEGLLPHINSKTNRIHSFFHQTITATGRISSTEPNLQNIPTRIELGKQLRKVFKPKEGYIYIDADYSQIELRVLAHISKDENMVEAFLKDEDIHKQAASKVLNIPIKNVTKEQRTSAKAVNFGIVYGISDYGLAEQLKISRKEAKEYIEQYLKKYKGIKKFMEEIVNETKEIGFVETLFHRRRYIPELNSNNYIVRQFGARAAMNTPIQGTAADIMKIAMINVFNKLNEEQLDAKIVLQVHDELIIECKIEEKDRVKQIIQENMENAFSLDVPLKVEICEAINWYEAK